MFSSALQVVNALDYVLQRVHLLLLVEFEQDYLFVELLDVLLPVLELLTLDARCVA